jgi:hypothetical protein
MKNIKYKITKELSCQDYLALANQLSKSALGLWYYLYSERPSKIKPSDYCKISGISRTRYYDSLNELIEKHFLLHYSEDTLILTHC